MEFEHRAAAGHDAEREARRDEPSAASRYYAFRADRESRTWQQPRTPTEAEAADLGRPASSDAPSAIVRRTVVSNGPPIWLSETGPWTLDARGQRVRIGQSVSAHRMAACSGHHMAGLSGPQPADSPCKSHDRAQRLHRRARWVLALALAFAVGWYGAMLLRPQAPVPGTDAPWPPVRGLQLRTSSEDAIARNPMPLRGDAIPVVVHPSGTSPNFSREIFS